MDSHVDMRMHMCPDMRGDMGEGRLEACFVSMPPTRDEKLDAERMSQT